MTNLTERLMKPLADRIGSTLVTNPAFSIMEGMDFEMAEAADAIETLTRQRDEVREALKPFAKLFPDTSSINGVWCKDYEDSRAFAVFDAFKLWDFTMGDIRRARAALKQEDAK